MYIYSNIIIFRKYIYQKGVTYVVKCFSESNKQQVLENE